MSETKEFKVIVNVGGSFEYTVEAEDEESAEDIARERAEKDYKEDGIDNPYFEVDNVEEVGIDNDSDTDDRDMAYDSNPSTEDDDEL